MARIEHDRAQLDADRGARHPKTAAMTITLMQRLEEHYLGSGKDEHTMLIAAAYLALAGGFRPSEVLGSTRAKRRRLRLSQLEFTKEIEANEQHDSTPAHYVDTLYVSKTKRTSSTRIISWAPAVAAAALTNWIALRAERHNDSRILFKLSCYSPLTSKTLITRINTALLSAQAINTPLTAKAFRVYRPGLHPSSARRQGERHQRGRRLERKEPGVEDLRRAERAEGAPDQDQQTNEVKQQNQPGIKMYRR